MNWNRLRYRPCLNPCAIVENCLRWSDPILYSSYTIVFEDLCEWIAYSCFEIFKSMLILHPIKVSFSIISRLPVIFDLCLKHILYVDTYRSVKSKKFYCTICIILIWIAPPYCLYGKDCMGLYVAKHMQKNRLLCESINHFLFRLLCRKSVGKYLLVTLMTCYMVNSGDWA